MINHQLSHLDFGLHCDDSDGMTTCRKLQSCRCERLFSLSLISHPEIIDESYHTAIRVTSIYPSGASGFTRPSALSRRWQLFTKLTIGGLGSSPPFVFQNTLAFQEWNVATAMAMITRLRNINADNIYEQIKHTTNRNCQIEQTTVSSGSMLDRVTLRG